jgi:hypothetical protein
MVNLLVGYISCRRINSHHQDSPSCLIWSTCVQHTSFSGGSSRISYQTLHTPHASKYLLPDRLQEYWILGRPCLCTTTIQIAYTFIYSNIQFVMTHEVPSRRCLRTTPIFCESSISWCDHRPMVPPNHGSAKPFLEPVWIEGDPNTELQLTREINILIQ